MDDNANGRRWPGDLGSDHTAAGSVRRLSAFLDGLRTNRRGRHRAARMLLVLGLVVVVVGLAVALVS